MGQSNQLVESQPASKVPVTTCLQHALLLHPVPEPQGLCVSRHMLVPPTVASLGSVLTGN